MTTTVDQLKRSAPEAQGIASSAISAFVDALEQQVRHVHSFMLLRHGHVVAEGWWAPYQPDAPHMLFSLSKSFTSTAIGLAVAEGRLSVDDTVLSFFPDDAPAEVSPNLAAMHVHHLLSMSTGHDYDTTGTLHEDPDGNWTRAFLACPVKHTPGTHFLYNTGATYMLSAIIQKVTGETLLDYLWPRLLTPLGIEQASWEMSPQGINTGGYGLKITTDGIARFIQMYLQKGEWQSQQLVPADWVAEATKRQVDNNGSTVDWAQGYGYQFWRSQHNAYRGDGAFGQYGLVLPEQDAVLAITSGLRDMQHVLDLVWEHLLPAMGVAALPEASRAQTALAQKLASLALPTPEGQASTDTAAIVSGRTYRFANEQPDAGSGRRSIVPHAKSIAFDFSDSGAQISLEDQHGTHQFAAGYGSWQAGTFGPERESFGAERETAQPIAAAGAWTGADTYAITIYFTETPFSWTASCRFVDDRVLLDFAQNVSFGPTEFAQLEGRAE